MPDDRLRHLLRVHAGTLQHFDDRDGSELVRRKTAQPPIEGPNWRARRTGNDNIIHYSVLLLIRSETPSLRPHARLDGGERRHIDDAPDRADRPQNVYGLC